MSSSLLPLNMLPVITSIQPWLGTFRMTSMSVKDLGIVEGRTGAQHGDGERLPARDQVTSDDAPGAASPARGHALQAVDHVPELPAPEHGVCNRIGYEHVAAGPDTPRTAIADAGPSLEGIVCSTADDDRIQAAFEAHGESIAVPVGSGQECPGARLGPGDDRGL